MIHVDESDPVGENESPFATRTVKIARGLNPEDKYELIRELGRGKFGTVYRCREKATNLQLAAKFVGIPNRGDRRNVEREVDIMNTLQHHLITQLYDAFEYQKMMCVVLELIEGGELFDRVIGDDFILTERACIVFVRQICEALEFVHRNHIVHLDLKPENILCLSRAGNRIKIIDFGLARKFDPDKKMQILFGTPEFVAPEVVNFDAIGFSTDMWSVGVICYVLLSGLSPFMGETDVETMGNVTVAKYDFDDEAFNDISEEALSFITHLLVKEPEKRMTATECLQHDWLLRRAQQTIPSKVQLISDLSSPVCLAADNDADSSTLSDIDNSESDYGVEAMQEDREVPPPLPKTQPPPFELLMETSLPIIILAATTKEPSIAAAPVDTMDDPPRTTAENITELANGIDKQLDITKDNLKTFVERWDGSQPVGIPMPSEESTLKPTAKPKKSSSTSSLSHAEGGNSKKEAAPTTNNGVVGESSDFITPPRDDNDLEPFRTSPNHKQEQLPGAKAKGMMQVANGVQDVAREKEITKDNDVVQVTSPGNITKHLLEQLEQIEIKSGPKTKKVQTDKTVNGVNYLQVGDNLATSTPSSTSSSRGCSPSPCESLTSSADTQEQQAEQDAMKGESPSSPAGLLQDYLQSFDRRKSDSNYVLGNKNDPTNTAEKMDLGDEIKRLSDHLMMLNTLKTELGEKAEAPSHSAIKEALKESTDTPLKGSGGGKPNGAAHEKRAPRTRPTDQGNLSSKLESKIVKSQIRRFSNSNGGTAQETSTTQVTTNAGQQQTSSSSSSSFHFARSLSSVRTATRLIEEQHKPQTPISQPSWMLKCKRTKFRMTELSRDVPQNAPNSHKTVFIEEAAANTKDCLLQLLDKYNHSDGAEDDFTKRSLDIDRSVIPSSSSSSSSSIASLPPVAKSNDSGGAGSKVTKTSTQTCSTVSSTGNGGETVTKTKHTTTRTTTTSSTSKTVSSTRTEEYLDNSMEGAELEGKTGAGHTEFAKSIPRHFSLSLNWDKDSLEETTMNSLNAFFQRHSSHVGSSTVKQIQQQMEGKRVPQK